MFRQFTRQQTNKTSTDINATSIDCIIEKTQKFYQLNLQWEAFPDELQNNILDSIKYISHSLQYDDILKLHNSLQKINLPFNKLPYETFRLCLGAHFEKALSSPEWRDILSFCELLIKLKLSRDELPCQDMNKLFKKINAELSTSTDTKTLVRTQKILHHFEFFIPNKIHKLFLECKETRPYIRNLNGIKDKSHPVYEYVRQLHIQCHKNDKPRSIEIKKLLTPILQEKNPINAREISSICASLGRISFRWDIHPEYSSQISSFLTKNIPEMDPNQLISLLKDRSLAHFINTESHHRKSTLSLIVARFIELADKMPEDELITCFKDIRTIKKFKSAIYQTERNNFFNAFYLNLINKHKIGFDSSQLLTNIIPLFKTNGITRNQEENFQKLIINYLTCWVSSFDCTFNNLPITKKINLISLIQSCKVEDNPELKKLISSLLITMKDELLTTSFTLKQISRINQILANHDDLATLGSLFKSSFGQNSSTIEKPEGKRPFRLGFFNAPMNMADEKQLINNHFEILSCDLSNKQKADRTMMPRSR